MPERCRAMSQIHLRIDAGCEHMETIYPVVNRSDSRTTRGGKKAIASEAKRRINDAAAYRKLEMELAANYRVGDLILTLTFDNAHLPDNRRQVKAQVKKFTSRLRELRAAKGQGLVYHYREEHKHLSKDAAMDGRWHVHMVVNATGKDYKLIPALWGNGRVDIQRLEISRDRNYETLARYMTKEPRDKLGQRLWSSSRGAAKPQRDRRRVGNGEKIKLPRNAIVLSDTGNVETAYGYYRFVRYILPNEITVAPGGSRI